MYAGPVQAYLTYWDKLLGLINFIQGKSTALCAITSPIIHWPVGYSPWTWVTMHAYVNIVRICYSTDRPCDKLETDIHMMRGLAMDTIDDRKRML